MDAGVYENYSVLMSVYHKEKPAHLEQAIESIQRQTRPADDFVLVCDGPLSAELDTVITEKQRELGAVLHVVRLMKNGGLGSALNAGIACCKNELVARMDSDDIAYPERCEKQLAVFCAHPEISICSGTVEEFSASPEIVDVRRVLPETNAEIIRFAKKRNPFNHPCVMYKKSAVEAVGSYMDFYLLEDYYLWLRMLMAGYQGYNLQEPLLHMRASIRALAAPGTPSARMKTSPGRWASTCVTTNCWLSLSAPHSAAWRARCSAHFRASFRRNLLPCRSRLRFWRWWCWAGWGISPA